MPLRMEALSHFLHARRRSRLHILEYGIRWPPETFIASKLEGLARRGYRVTAVVGRGQSGHAPPGIDVLPLIPSGRTRFAHLAAAATVARLVLRSPRRAAVVVRAASRPTAAGRPVRGRPVIERLRVYARLAALRPDIIHFEWVSTAIRHYSLAEALGCPVVVSCRGTEVNVHPHTPSTEGDARALKLVLGRAAAVHCVSDAMREEAARYLLDPAKTWLIRPAVNPGFFQPARMNRASDSSFRVVAVGSLRWRKAFEYALLAVAALAREDVPIQLEIVGGDPSVQIKEESERGRLCSTIAALGLEDRVVLRGHLQPSDVRAALHAADAFLQTSLSEGLPNVILEAMACGLPVVATDVGGTREAVRNGNEGFLVAPRDVAGMVSALRSLWTDPALRKRMGAAGRARVESEFKVEEQIDRWVELYQQVGANGNGSARRPIRLAELGIKWPPETFLVRKLENLAAGGFEPRIVTPFVAADPPPLPGVTLERLDGWTEASGSLARALLDAAALLVRHPRRLRSFMAARRTLSKNSVRLPRLSLRLARLDADLVHFEWEQTAATFLPLLGLWNRPVAVSCRGSALRVRPHTPRGEDERLKELLPKVFEGAAAVHCVSETMLRDAARYGLDEGKAWVIRSGVDGAFFHPAPYRRPSPNRFRISSLGSLRWVKGFEYTLLAIAELARAGCPVSFEIAGGDPPDHAGVATDRARILGAVSALGLEGRVTLHGIATPAEVRRMLQRSDVLLQSSLSEGLPNAVLEAMACGLPVVATDVGGTSEAVCNGVEGFLVAPRDVDATATALATLWRDPELRARMGAAGRARVEAEFTVEREAREWRAFYEHLATGAGAVS